MGVGRCWACHICVCNSVGGSVPRHMSALLRVYVYGEGVCDLESEHHWESGHCEQPATLTINKDTIVVDVLTAALVTQLSELGPKHVKVFVFESEIF